MDPRSLTAGVVAALPFATSVALLCTTSVADGFYRAAASIAMLAMFAGAMALQAVCGVRAFRGAPLVRPLAAGTAGYLVGVFAVLLAADAVVRLSGVKGEALPAGLGGAAAEWVPILASLASVPVLSAVVVAVAVAAARDRLRAPLDEV